MDLDAFVAEHGGEWHRLRTLAARRRLTADEADEMVMLYQRTTTHLSIVRSRTPDAVVLTELSNLVLAARAALTRGTSGGWRSVGRFFTTTLPAELYRARRWWVITSLASLAAGIGLVLYFAGHPNAVAVFMSPEQQQQYINNDFVGYYSAYKASSFGLQVWTNNAVLTAKCVASGVLVLPVLYLSFQNLLNVGLGGGVMLHAGHIQTFLLYIAPHGLLELTCVFIGAGVGLRIGWAWIAPGPSRTRIQAAVDEGRAGIRISVGLGCALAVAGFLESVITPSGLPPLVRVGIGFLVWLLFLGYALIVGRHASLIHRPEDEDQAAYLVPTA